MSALEPDPFPTAALRKVNETRRPVRAVDRTRRAIDRELRRPRHEARGDEVGRPTVVVAEPDFTERIALLHLLRHSGRVSVSGDAVDGAEALGVIIALQPDLAVLAERLPTLSACEITASLELYAPSTRCVLVIDRDQAPDCPDLTVFRRGDHNNHRDLVDFIVEAATR